MREWSSGYDDFFHVFEMKNVKRSHRVNLQSLIMWITTVGGSNNKKILLGGIIPSSRTNINISLKSVL